MTRTRIVPAAKAAHPSLFPVDGSNHRMTVTHILATASDVISDPPKGRRPRAGPAAEVAGSWDTLVCKPAGGASPAG